MINVYELELKDQSGRSDINRVRSVYNQLLQPEPIGSAKFSILRPYTTVDQVMRALSQDPVHPHETLSKISNQMRQNPDSMIQLIEKTKEAYSYVSPKINNEQFKKDAIAVQPNVFSGMSVSEKENQSIIEAYRDAMIRKSKEHPLDYLTRYLQPANQFDAELDVRKAFSPEFHKQNYEHVVINGMYQENSRTLTPQAATVCLCEILNRDDSDEFNKNKRDAWERHPEKVAEWASKDRRSTDVNLALTAIEHVAPTYVQKIEELQKVRWLEKQFELMELKQKEERGERVNGNEFRMLREAERHISLDPVSQAPSLELSQDLELKENLKKIDAMVAEIKNHTEKLDEKVKREREQDLAGLLQDSKTRILSAAADGDITLEMASDALGYLGNIPTVVANSRAQAALAHAEARENDIDNIDLKLNDGPELSEMPTVEEKVHVREKKEEKDTQKEIERDMEVEEYSYEEYDEYSRVR